MFQHFLKETLASALTFRDNEANLKTILQSTILTEVSREASNCGKFNLTIPDLLLCAQVCSIRQQNFLFNTISKWKQFDMNEIKFEPAYDFMDFIKQIW